MGTSPGAESKNRLARNVFGNADRSSFGDLVKRHSPDDALWPLPGVVGINAFHFSLSAAPRPRWGRGGRIATTVFATATATSVGDSDFAPERRLLCPLEHR